MIVGLFAIELDQLAIAEWPSLHSVGAATLILFFAFAGAETGLSSSGEIKNPQKTVPLGLLLGLGGILALYVGLQVVAQGVLGAELAESTEAPLAAAAEQVFGSWGGKLLLVTGVISIYATVSGDVLNTPRVIFASSLDGNLPRFLSRVHPRYRTPSVAIIVFALMICAFALSGTFKPLAVVASGSILIIYLGVSLAVIRLRLRDGAPSPDEFSIPGGPVVPLLSCLTIVWLLLQLTREEAIALAVLCGVSVALFGARAVVGRASRETTIR